MAHSLKDLSVGFGASPGASFPSGMLWQHVSADGILKKPVLRRERNASEIERQDSTKGPPAAERQMDSGISSRATSHSQSEWCASPALARQTRHGSVCDVEEGTLTDGMIRKNKLIDDLKREVKVLMEQAADNRTVDLNSGYVTALCVAVQHCVMDGIRKRFLGLIRMKSSLALLHTVAKGFPGANVVIERTAEHSRPDSCSSEVAWIREALHMRLLSSILNYISTSKEMRRLYDDDALMLDRAKGGMPAALLLGPCAITYKRMSESSSTDTTNRIEWMERMNREPSTSSTSRPPLSVKRQGSSLVSIERQCSSRDYVFSLHANYRSTLLYGKNNVSVEDVEGDGDASKGYLSLHKNFTGDLTLRWTPNQLMHACSQPNSATSKDDGKFPWRQAITMEMNNVIYIHLHQKDEDSTSCITFVSCEGGQSAPLHFPSGQHSLVFLTALEAGMAPLYRLDPPLSHDMAKEKSLPRLRRRTSATNASADYVFRIVRLTAENSVPAPPPEEIAGDDLVPSVPPSPTNGFISLPASPAILSDVDSLVNAQVGQACRSMQNQIKARAFFGWLSYCRHLHTVREHLIGLIHRKECHGSEDLPPVDEAFWAECRANRTPELWEEFLLRVYWSGIEGEDQKSIRRQAWPYLLGLFEWTESPEPKTTEFTEAYRNDVEEWRVLEAEVRRRDEEAFNAARARKGATPIRELSMTNDVFDEDAEDSEERKKDKEQEMLIDRFGANLHRIEKDVERCDRALRFFQNAQNLESLRRVVCTYVRRNLDDDGYVQGMCDIVAPLLVIFEDEALTLECYSILMSRMKENFPHHAGMDRCLSNLRSLVQVVDPQIFTILSGSADFTQLYFSYRWFLLDFKRELTYDGVNRVWETIWACRHLQSEHFPLFFALAMLTNYRDAIVENSMDFADLIKFFNDMTARHDVNRLLTASRGHLTSLLNILNQME